MTSDEPMRRTAGVTYEPSDRADVVDFAADYALDAAEAGVHPDAVASALREAADEVEFWHREGALDTDAEPDAYDPRAAEVRIARGDN